MNTLISMKTALLALALVVSGCGGKTNDDATDASTTEDTGAGSSNDSMPGDSDAPDAAGVCNTLDNSGAKVQPEGRPESPPMPRGGVVSEGAYELVSSITYTGVGGLSGPRGETEKATLTVTGSTAQVVQMLGDARDTHGTATITFGGTRVSMTFTCPGNFAAPWDGYDASADRFALHNSKIGLVATYAKR